MVDLGSEDCVIDIEFLHQRLQLLDTVGDRSADRRVERLLEDLEVVLDVNEVVLSHALAEVHETLHQVVKVADED